MYKLSDYQYELPESLIAQEPANPVDHSRLLVPDADGTSFHDYHFYDILTLLSPKDVLFFNDTKVIKARVPVHNILVEIPHHPSASRVVEDGEIFFLEMVDEYRFEWLVTLTKRVRKWSVLHFREDIRLVVEDLTDKGVLFHLEGAYVFAFFEMYGQMPLPPYIAHAAEKEKHYQTIFAQELGSVAAPTASLHFTHDLLQSLSAQHIRFHYLTLHVWLWTFKPVDTDDIRSYHIHEETIIIDEEIFNAVAKEKQASNNVIAVGTTVARTLETLPYLYKAMKKTWDEYFDTITSAITQEQVTTYILSWKEEGRKIICQTRIFIYPGLPDDQSGFKWRIVDGLITNFHLPWSTLLMLVASFVGYETMMKIYAHAIDQQYRFFSFGDAMLLRRY